MMKSTNGVDAEVDLVVYFHELQNAGLFHQGCVRHICPDLYLSTDIGYIVVLSDSLMDVRTLL